MSKLLVPFLCIQGSIPLLSLWISSSVFSHVDPLRALLHPQRGITAIRNGQQLLMTTTLHNLALMQNQNLVHMSYCRQSMRHNDCGPVLADLVEALLNQSLCARVQR